MRFVKFQLLTFLLSATCPLHAQDTLRLTRSESEGLFLTKNLLLIAEKLEISKSDAVIQQARVWPNPNFTLDQVNLWATAKQTGGQEAVPPLFGNFGQNQQFGAELEQVILTARKRSKLVALEQVSKEKALSYFDELVRNLKLEFRKNLTELRYLEESKSNHRIQLSATTQLIRAYQRQVEEGHAPKSELIRLKALELELRKNLNELQAHENEIQKELKIWMHLPANAYVMISDQEPTPSTEKISSLQLTEILEEAKRNRPDLRLAIAEEHSALRRIDYEKAKRVPNINLKASYDRNGNTMLNFFGFGASVDLPFFDRNQGAIKAAQIEASQSKTLLDYQTHQTENEVILAYQNLKNAIEFDAGIEKDYENTLNELLGAYTRNFSQRTISLLEFIDFMNAWLENKHLIISTRKTIHQKVEELNYAVGRDIL
jgi:cobalt-zinc-cadmium efflux system outer membrane protein